MISTQGRSFFLQYFYIYLLSFYKKAENSMYMIIGISVTFDEIQNQQDGITIVQIIYKLNYYFRNAGRKRNF